MSRFYEYHKIGFQPHTIVHLLPNKGQSTAKECNVITEMFSKRRLFFPTTHTESSVAGIKEALQTGRMGLFLWGTSSSPSQAIGLAVMLFEILGSRWNFSLLVIWNK